MSGTVRITKGMIHRLEQLRKSAGLSVRGLSIGAGLSEDYVRSFKKQYEAGKQHNLPEESVVAIARTLKSSPEYLIHGGPGGADLRGRQTALPVSLATGRAGQSVSGGVQVSGHVSAGTWLEATSNHSDESPLPFHVPADPRYPVERQFAVMVHGSSINRVAQEGDILLVVDEVLTPRAGDMVIAKRTRAGLHELTAKRFCPIDENTVELRHDSVDPRFTNPDTPGYSPPIRIGKNDDSEGTQIVITGVVLGVWRPLI